MHDISVPANIVILISVENPQPLRVPDRNRSIKFYFRVYVLYTLSLERERPPAPMVAAKRRTKARPGTLDGITIRKIGKFK